MNRKLVIGIVLGVALVARWLYASGVVGGGGGGGTSSGSGGFANPATNTLDMGGFSVTNADSLIVNNVVSGNTVYAQAALYAQIISVAPFPTDALNLTISTNTAFHFKIAGTQTGGTNAFRLTTVGLNTVPFWFFQDVGERNLYLGPDTSQASSVLNSGGVVAVVNSLALTNVPLGASSLVVTNGNDATAVRGDWSKPYLTVTNALGLAQAGDVIRVGPGWYSGAGVVATNVTLIGDDPARTVLTAVTNTTTAILTLGQSNTIANLSIWSTNATAPCVALGDNGVLNNVWLVGSSNLLIVAQPNGIPISQTNYIVGGRWIGGNSLMYQKSNQCLLVRNLDVVVTQVTAGAMVRAAIAVGTTDRGMRSQWYDVNFYSANTNATIYVFNHTANSAPARTNEFYGCHFFSTGGHLQVGGANPFIDPATTYDPSKCSAALATTSYLGPEALFNNWNASTNASRYLLATNGVSQSMTNLGITVFSNAAVTVAITSNAVPSGSLGAVIINYHNTNVPAGSSGAWGIHYQRQGVGAWDDMVDGSGDRVFGVHNTAGSFIGDVFRISTNNAAQILGVGIGTPAFAGYQHLLYPVTGEGGYTVHVNGPNDLPSYSVWDRNQSVFYWKVNANGTMISSNLALTGIISNSAGLFNNAVTALLSGTTTAGGLVTNYFAGLTTINNAIYSPTNNNARWASISAISTNMVVYHIFGAAAADCGACSVVGPATAWGTP